MANADIKVWVYFWYTDSVKKRVIQAPKKISMLNEII